MGFQNRSHAKESVRSQPITSLAYTVDVYHFIPRNLATLGPSTSSIRPVPYNHPSQYDHIQNSGAKAHRCTVSPHPSLRHHHLSHQWSSLITVSTEARISYSTGWTPAEEDAFWRIERSGSHISEPLWAPWRRSEECNEVWGLVQNKRDHTKRPRLGMSHWRSWT